MKSRKIIATALLSALSLSANAQIMRIEMTGGKQMEIPVSSVTSISWYSNEPEETEPTTPDVSPAGVQAVDLGLPSGIKWANMNIGAESPEDYGDYFAWGETTGYKDGKRVFSNDTYKYYLKTTTTIPETTDKDGFVIPAQTISTSGYTKYVTKSRASNDGYDGFYDDKTVLGPEDDAAIANWGGSWRMPTKAEQDELRTSCTWEWKELKGVKGYKVTGPNGNFIFLPAAGYRFDSRSYFVVSTGDYWSSSLLSGDSNYAYRLYFNSDFVDWYSNDRSNGRSVRAVCP